MAQYLLSVWHDDEYDLDFTTEDMQRIGPKVEPSTRSSTGRGPWPSPAA
jgi:hypothetical protein